MAKTATTTQGVATPHVHAALATPDPDAFGIDEFCKRHSICRATFYNLATAGRAPRIMKVGSRTLISREAAADWRRQMEAEATV